MISISKIRSQARQTLDTTQGIYTLAIIPAIITVISTLMSLNSETVLYSDTDSLFSLVVGRSGFPLVVGILTGFLTLSIIFTLIPVVQQAKNRVTFSDAFTIFSSPHFGKIFWTVFLKQFLLFLWGLVMFIGLGILIASVFVPAFYLVSKGVTDPSILPEDTLVIIGMGMIIGLLLSIAGFALYIPQFYAYSQVDFILFQQLEKGTYAGAFPIIRQSRKLMVGYKWQRFVLDLTFLGWFILSAISFGILGLYVIPYYRAAEIHFHKALLVARNFKVTDAPQPPIMEV